MDTQSADDAREMPSDLTLTEAAEQYAISARTLAQHIRCGQLPAYKTTATTGRQWRVTRDALDAAGYVRRTAPAADETESAIVTELRRQLAAARRATAAERRRADDIDRRLGHAMLECGRLRTALAAATGRDDAAAPIDLTSGEARWLVDIVRGSTTEQR